MPIGVSTTLTPEERSMRARLAAHARWGKAPAAKRKEQGEILRAGFRAQFLAEVDRENPGLPEAERQRLASSKISAHMLRLRLMRSKRARAGGEAA